MGIAFESTKSELPARKAHSGIGAHRMELRHLIYVLVAKLVDPFFLSVVASNRILSELSVRLDDTVSDIRRCRVQTVNRLGLIVMGLIHRKSEERASTCCFEAETYLHLNEDKASLVAWQVPHSVLSSLADFNFYLYHDISSMLAWCSSTVSYSAF